MFVGSDAIALAPMTDRITYLEEGDWAVVTRAGAEIYDADGRLANRADAARSSIDADADRQGRPPAFHGQGDRRAAHRARPTCSAPTSRRRRATLDLPEGIDFAAVDRLIDRRLRHRLLRRPGGEILVRAARPPAGRDRYRLRVPLPRAADRAAARSALFVSQSGETADTLAALRYCDGQGRADRCRWSTCPKARSRAKATSALPIHAGPEIGVASTKAFTCQLTVLRGAGAQGRASSAARSTPRRWPRHARRAAQAARR